MSIMGSDEKRRCRNYEIAKELKARLHIFGKEIAMQNDFDAADRVRFDRELALETYELGKINEALEKLHDDPDYSDVVLIGSVEVFLRSYQNVLSRMREACIREPGRLELLAEVIYERRQVLLKMFAMAEAEMDRRSVSSTWMRMVDGMRVINGSGNGAA
jgi:hypothetical protein